MIYAIYILISVTMLCTNASTLYDAEIDAENKNAINAVRSLCTKGALRRYEFIETWAKEHGDDVKMAWKGSEDITSTEIQKLWDAKSLAADFDAKQQNRIARTCARILKFLSRGEKIPTVEAFRHHVAIRKDFLGAYSHYSEQYTLHVEAYAKGTFVHTFDAEREQKFHASKKEFITATERYFRESFGKYKEYDIDFSPVFISYWVSVFSLLEDSAIKNHNPAYIISSHMLW